MGKQWKQWQTLFSWAPKSLRTVTAAMKLKDTCSLEEKLRHLDSILKSRDITLLTKFLVVKIMVFPVVMYGCESWTINKAEHQIFDAFKLWLEKTLECPLDCMKIKPVNPKGNQPWIFIGRTDTKPEAPILRPSDVKNQLTGKVPDPEKDWRQEEKGATEDGWMASLIQWTWV